MFNQNSPSSTKSVNYFNFTMKVISIVQFDIYIRVYTHTHTYTRVD